MQHAKQTDVVSDPAAEQGSLVCRNYLKQAEIISSKLARKGFFYKAVTRSSTEVHTAKSL